MVKNDSNKYKKFFFQTIICSAIAWFGLQLCVYFLCRPAEWYWINDTIKIKENIARNIKGKKIVFVGGSATLFGVRTADIERELHIPTVNYGVHAALEIDYILERAKKILKPGDIVILTLEHGHLRYDGNLNEVRARYIMLFDKQYYNSLPLLEKINYFLKFSPLTIELSFWKLFWQIVDKKQLSANYNANTLNANGDETNNIGNDIIKRKYEELQPFSIQKGKFKETVGLKTLNKFNNWCNKNNIKFYVTYAGVMSFDIYHSEEYQEYFKEVQDYFKKHNIATIGSPNDFFYKTDLFYDTIYHLNSKGMTCHTKNILSKIKDIM